MVQAYYHIPPPLRRGGRGGCCVHAKPALNTCFSRRNPTINRGFTPLASGHLFIIHGVWQPAKLGLPILHKSLRHNDFIQTSPNSRHLGYPNAQGIMLYFGLCNEGPKPRQLKKT